MAPPPKESAKFVFHGTVKRLRSANLKAISDTDRTAVVTIDKVVRAPAALAKLAGRDVTVRLAEGESLNRGDHAVFHTNGWIFGENLAVQSLGHDPIDSAMSARAAAGIDADPARAAAHQRIRERVATAAAVITGRVVAVGLPSSGAAPPAATAAVAQPPPWKRPISEHEPFWREAVVEVEKVHKGSVGKPQVVLRFPSSTDVRWHKAPKFQAGQQGVFSLRSDEISGHTTVGPTAASMNVTADAAFTALHSADFQPLDDAADVAVAVSAAEN